jgi:hypothetical protein
MKEETGAQELKKVKTKDLVMAEPFESLFSVDTETYKQTYSKVYVNMDLLGFDKTQPIIVRKDKNIVIDGHTRLRAARQKGIEEVWVIEKDFLNEDDAIQYVIHLHRDRRKLTDVDIFRLVTLLDKKYPEGRPPKTASTDAVSNRSRTSKKDTCINDILFMSDSPPFKEFPKVCAPETPYPKNGHPETALNVAIHKKIPNTPTGTRRSLITLAPPGSSAKIVHVPPTGRKEIVISNPTGGSILQFAGAGDLRKGLAKFKEWAYGRSSDITATLIGTSSTKVEKCRRIKDCKDEDLKDKVLRGKLTINRAYSILKNNGKRGNDPKLKFQKGVEVHTKNQSIDSINSDSINWIILGTSKKPPEINDPIPKNSVILPKE